MATFKCKMCGGALDVNDGSTVAECEYCGTKQTLPRLNDERIANLYDRANHFRRNNEFDKAIAIYEQVLNEDGSDAEAYWSLVLCNYGIEYVEDPKSHRRVPTVHRAQLTSIFDDDNYKLAIEKADISQRMIYEAEAKQINEIQKGILAISDKEEPFDIFICYKETDSYGRRTPDSVIAQDLYNELTEEGFKVFFSRITLEDKLGTAYEPYIFAALNSAKVMIVLGTRAEYFNAVWVKNEWSRYLALIKKGDKKTLVPAYKDMDPYDLPAEFSHLQAQDMSKLGFMQDLVRGIKKIIAREQTTAGAANPSINNTVNNIVNTGVGIVSGVVRGVKDIFVGDRPAYQDPSAFDASNVQALLRRADMFIEDGDFRQAVEYAERVLDVMPENAEAYRYKLMADLRIRKREQIAMHVNRLVANSNYKRMMLYADDELKNEMQGYINAHVETTYNVAKKLMAENTIAQYDAAIRCLNKIPDYKDSKNLIRVCELEKTYILANQALAYKNYPLALQKFRSISSWRDSAKRAEAVERLIEQGKEKLKKVGKTAGTTAAIIVSVCLALVLIVLSVCFVAGWRRISRNGEGRRVARQEITTYTVPDSTNKIGARDYKNCTSLKSVTIPEGVTEIGDYAFKGCTNLESVYIPGTVKRIGRGAFKGCISLKVVVIPDSVKRIEVGAFADCYSLKSISLPFVGERSNGIGKTHFGHIFGASSDLYNSDYVPSSLTSVRIRGGEIDADAFYNCRYLKHVYIDSEVETIGSYAFFGCSGMGIFHCEASSRPNGWANNWNTSSGSVRWGDESVDDWNRFHGYNPDL